MALKFLEPVVEVRQRPGPRPLLLRQPGLDRVMAMVELRDHMRGHHVAVLAAEQAARKKDRAVTFVLFWLMAALLVGAMWAGVHG
jgi:hypothetical protein